MNFTNSYLDVEPQNVYTLTTPQLQTCLGCGRYAAVHIGEKAEAKIKIGGRVLWNAKKIQNYLDKISGGKEI